jgi:hypothetical protein
MILILTSVVSSAQNRISGLVTEENNIPLKNVIIEIKDRGIFSKTNSAGFYSIEFDSLSKVISFSLKGYNSKEITIESSSTINVTLKKEEATGIKRENIKETKYKHKSFQQKCHEGYDCYNIPYPGLTILIRRLLNY